jgi:predicted RND superfamily exporter protein
VYLNDKRIKATFDIREFMIIGVKNDTNLFNPTTFKYLKGLINKIELIDGVFKVRSLFSEDNIKSISEDSLDISPFIKGIDAELLKDSVEQLRNFDAVQGILVSNDFTLTTILVELEEDADKNRIYFETKEIFKASPPPHEEEIHLSGMPVFQGVLGSALSQDLLVMIPMASIVITIFLYFTYRSILLVGVSLIVVFLVNIWTVGFMAILGEPLYAMQGVMPVILMALSVADEIHILGRYFEEHKNISTALKDKILIVMEEMWKPVVLTSITTACGFLALTMTSMKPLQAFGVFTAFGIMVAMLLALFLTPVAIKLYGERWGYNASHTVIDNSLLILGRFMFKNRTKIRIVISIIILVALIGLSKSFYQESWISNFKDTSTVYVDDVALNKKMAGTNIFYIEIDTLSPNGIKNSVFLKNLVKFHDQIGKFDGIGSSISMAKIIQKMNLEFAGQHTIPDSSDTIAQYLLLLDGSSHETFWDYPYQKINITVFSKAGDYLSSIPFFKSVQSSLKKLFPNAIVTFGGELLLSCHSVDLLKKDQLKSFMTSLVLILLISATMYKSLRKGIIVTSPILMAVCICFGILGFLKIPISVTVSVFSSIILGIGIDYAIHMQSKFDLLKGKVTIREVIPNMYVTAGKAVFWNAVVVIAGFLILIFSEMPPNQKLGLVCALGVSASLISSFLIVPALISTKH